MNKAIHTCRIIFGNDDQGYAQCARGARDAAKNPKVVQKTYKHLINILRPESAQNYLAGAKFVQNRK